MTWPHFERTDVFAHYAKPEESMKKKKKKVAGKRQPKTNPLSNTGVQSLTGTAINL